MGLEMFQKIFLRILTVINTLSRDPIKVIYLKVIIIEV